SSSSSSPSSSSFSARSQVWVSPSSSRAKKGERVSFRCLSTIDPSLSPPLGGGIRWFRHGKPLRDSPDSDK
ncbi:NGCA protein, partial [Turnix velox]|nr:NGCA protein [Turnix velox]